MCKRQCLIAEMVEQEDNGLRDLWFKSCTSSMARLYCFQLHMTIIILKISWISWPCAKEAGRATSLNWKSKETEKKKQKLDLKKGSSKNQFKIFVIVKKSGKNCTLMDANINKINVQTSWCRLMLWFKHSWWVTINVLES